MRIKTLGFMVMLALLAAPIPSHGQQAGKIYRIGFLGTSPGDHETDSHQCMLQGSPSWQGFVEGLREYGYTPGQNLLIECRWTRRQAERAPALAAELVGLKPDLIVAVARVPTQAAKQATTEIPIVFYFVTDPVRQGFVASLARPGGNVTGLTDAPLETERKRLQLLKEAVPKVSRVAVLTHPVPLPGPDLFKQEREAAARVLKVTLQDYDVRAPEEIAGAFAAMTKARAEALFVKADNWWWDHRERVIELTAQSRLPAIYYDAGILRAGGLMAYDADSAAITRRVGFYVDKIFHGAKPGDLPVERATKFRLVINLKTAKALGLTIPRSLLSRTDEVIQ